jgi:hypothetical protein
LRDPSQSLRDGLSINALNRVVDALSDTHAARRMQQAKGKLFDELRLTAQGRKRMRKGRGDGGLWKARKTLMLFSALRTGLGNRSNRAAKMKIARSDSHISSAPQPTPKLTQIQNPKGQNPIRLPFASFRLIFRLEKTLQLCVRSGLSVFHRDLENLVTRQFGIGISHDHIEDFI